jgi:hypothetical protein
MRASRERKRAAGFRLQQSWVLAVPQVYSDQQHLDAKSLAQHCVVARKVLARPALIGKAQTTLARWRWQCSPHEPEPPDLFEWGCLLQRSPQEVAAFLASMCEDATRLRRSSPFLDLLTRAERARIEKVFR